MAEEERFERLKQLIKKAQQDKESDFEKKETVEKIVERLKPSQQPQKGIDAERLKNALEKPKFEGNDRKKLEEDAKIAEKLSTLGGIYTAFEKPSYAIAEKLSTTNLTKGLSQSLSEAGIQMSFEVYLLLVSFFAIIAFIAVAITTSILLASIDAKLVALAPLLGIAGFITAIILGLAYPNSKAAGRAAAVNKELPFALRHLSTQIKSGVSFYKALQSVAKAGYGVLSEELEKTVSEINSGMSTEQALLRLHDRTKSKGLKRAITQIVRALKTGGNLTSLVNDIADDVSYEGRMQVRDFTEKLNLISIAFMMVAVVAPVMASVIAAVTQLEVFKAVGVTLADVIAIFAFITIAMVGIVFAIKVMDPTNA